MDTLKWIYTLVLAVLTPLAQAQDAPAWSLEKCVDYALQQNTGLRRSALANQTDSVSLRLAKAARFPSVVATAGQNLSWARSLNAQNEYGDYANTNTTSLGLNSSVVLFNGFRNRNTLRQRQTELQAGLMDTEAKKEELILSVMDAYLQVLYAEEQLKNSQSQVATTEKQLALAAERLALGAISKSDYLQVRSSLATQRQTVANAQSALSMARVSLMQLMELPVNEGFSIQHPNFGEALNQHRNPNATQVFEAALGIKPQVKSAQLSIESAQAAFDVARGGLWPTLSLSAALNTGYSSAMSGLGFGYQLGNRVAPVVGLSLSVPIFQNWQLRGTIANAQIGVRAAELTAIETKNSLRKAIEQACADVKSAEIEYEAGLDGYQAAQEAYNVANEKFVQGAINSVDYLIQKNTWVQAESSVLQAKYNLIFSYKTLDFYSGKTLSFD